MTLLLHISDTHFGTEQAPVVEALVALSHERRPDLIILSGDVTQRARTAQFDAARRTLDQLAAPCLVLPGNHDIPLYNLPERMFRPYGGFERVFGKTLEPIARRPDLLVIGVNTTRPGRHVDGEVSTRQIDRVASELRQADPMQLRIVVTHQPAAVVRAEDAHDRLINADNALQAWSAAGCDLILGGHIHLPYVVELTSLAKPTPRVMWAVQAGTAFSHRVRWGTANSVNLIHWDPPPAGHARRCKVERCDFDLATASFVNAAEHTLELA